MKAATTKKATLPTTTSPCISTTMSVLQQFQAFVQYFVPVFHPVFRTRLPPPTVNSCLASPCMAVRNNRQRHTWNKLAVHIEPAGLLDCEGYLTAWLYSVTEVICTENIQGAFSSDIHKYFFAFCVLDKHILQSA